MLRDNDKINGLGLSILMMMTIWEVGLVTIPRRAAQMVGTDAWLTAIVMAPLTVLLVVTITRLGLRFPNQTLIEYAPRIMGPLLGRAVGLATMAFWILVTARVARQVGDLIKTVLLDRTPLEVILLVLLLSAAYLSRHGVEPMARVAQIMILLVPPFFVMIALSLVEARPENLLPVLSNGPLPILRAAIDVLPQFEGLEIPLMLIPFLKIPGQATRAGVVALTVVGLSGIMIMVAIQTVIGVGDATEVLWPGLLVVQAVELPGFFLERLSTLFTALWIAVTLPTISVNLFLSALSLSRLARLSEQKPFVLPLVPLVFALALTPANLKEVEVFDKALSFLGMIVMVVTPLILLVVAKLRGLDDRKGNGEVADAR